LVRGLRDPARKQTLGGHLEHGANTPPLLRVDHELLGDGIGVVAERDRAADTLALAFEGRAHFGYPVADEFPLEFREDAQNVDDEVVLGRGAELRVCRHHQGNAALPEFLEELKAVDDVSGQAVQAVDEDAVYLPAAYFFEEALEGRAVECGAGVSFIVETLLDPPPSQPLLGLEVIPADLELGLARGEVTASIDGLAGVDGTVRNRKVFGTPRQGTLLLLFLVRINRLEIVVNCRFYLFFRYHGKRLKDKLCFFNGILSIVFRYSLPHVVISVYSAGIQRFQVIS